MTPSMRNFDVHHIDALSVDTMVEKFLGIFFYGILTTLDTGQSSGIFTEYQGNIVEHFLGKSFYTFIYISSADSSDDCRSIVEVRINF